MITSAEEFVALRTSEDPVDQERATRDRADVSVWLEVVATYPSMRQWVAHNKTVPSEVLHKLASDPDPAVRWEVAGKRKLDTEVLRLLASDSDDSVRVRVARHPRASTDLLIALRIDESWVVRQAADEALRARTSGEP
ncbi:HEAT repeat domain-containing protein [Kribbella sp. NBC_01245]|uniref:HEAT repeat domain-containing protein n=1 Tax=Kribbella sp. NBC_01245 TaxID=2903578 RepID=UPI002E2CA01A|nr:HEAT repeat domain-containing protein [Kribbella sp. NBC_01245]